MPALRLGYKASAEQFRPQRPARPRGRGRAGGLRLRLDQRPLPALAPHRTATRRTRSPGWARAAQRDQARHARHQRPDPVVPLQPGDRRPGVRARSAASPRAGSFLGVGTGEALNEVPVGIDWPEQSRSGSRASRRRSSSSSSSGPRSGVTSRATTTGPHDATIYDKPDGADAALHRGVRPGRRPARRPDRRRVHLHQRQGRRAVHARRSCRRSRRAPSKAGRDAYDDGQDDRDEGLVRHRPRAGDGGHQGLGRARAHAASRRSSIHDPREMERAGQGGRAQRPPPLARVGRPRRAPRAAQAVHRVRLHAPRVPLPGRRPGRRSSATASRSCRGSASASGS